MFSLPTFESGKVPLSFLLNTHNMSTRTRFTLKETTAIWELHQVQTPIQVILETAKRVNPLGNRDEQAIRQIIHRIKYNKIPDHINPRKASIRKTNDILDGVIEDIADVDDSVSYLGKILINGVEIKLPQNAFVRSIVVENNRHVVTLEYPIDG